MTATTDMAQATEAAETRYARTGLTLDAKRAVEARRAEHDAEHFDAIVMDCTVCIADYRELTGKA